MKIATHLFLLIFIAYQANSQKKWRETSFSTTEYGKKKDRDDGVFKDYDYVWAQPKGLYVVKKKTFYNDSLPTLSSFLVDKNGKILTKKVYTDIGDFSEGLAEVTIGPEDFCRSCYATGRYDYLLLLSRVCGFINEKGEEVISPKYRYVNGGFSHGYCSVGYISENFFINKEGKPQFNKVFKRADKFRKGIAQVTYYGDRHNYINTKGENLIPGKYTYIENWNDEFRGRIRAYQPAGQKIGFWTSEGLDFIEPQYDEVNYDLLKERIMVKKEGKIGFLDFYSGEVKLPILYKDYKKDISHENILLLKDSLWLKADYEGNITNLVVADAIEPIRKGLYKFKKEKWGIVDSLGKITNTNSYTKVANKITNNFLMVSENEKVGFLDINGLEVIPPRFTKIGIVKEGGFKAVESIYEYQFDKSGMLIRKSIQRIIIYRTLISFIGIVIIGIFFWVYREGKKT
jgi:hypothetical protein